MKNVARLPAMVVLGFLWAVPAMTEEGPRASAPLPPPLPAAPPEARSPPTDAKPPAQTTQEKHDPPKTEFDRSKPGSPQVNSSTPRHVTGSARNKNAPHPGDREKAGATHRVSRPTLASGNHGRNRPPALLQPGRLSPPPDLYPGPRIANTAAAQAEPPRASLPYFPEYPGGPPVAGYGNHYPYRWPPDGPAPFGPGY